MSNSSDNPLNAGDLHRAGRVETLRSYGILDTPREARFDDLTAIVANLLDTDYAAIAFFDENRIWFKSAIGLKASEVPIKGSLAELVIPNPDEVTIIPNLKTDPRLKVSAFRNEIQQIGTFAGAPLIAPNGEVIGTVSVIDAQEREFSNEDKAGLQRMARQIIDLMESRREAERLQESLRQQQAELRSIAVADRIARTLVSNVNTPALYASALDSFAQAVINEFGWWAAQVWHQEEEELIPHDFIFSTSAPRAITSLKKLPVSSLPSPSNEELELSAFEAKLPALQTLDRQNWHPRFEALVESGARDFVQLEIAGPNYLAIRILFILPSSRALTPDKLESLTSAANLLPQVVRRARSGVELEYQATHDQLTGLLNRRGLEKSFASPVAGPFTPPLRSIFFFDLDKFKLVNDTYGHGIGDELLIEVAKRIKQSSRPVDLLARLGGDEFVMISQGFEDVEALTNATDRLMETLSAPFKASNSVTLKPLVSIGISTWDGFTPLSDAIAQSDSMMYEAKSTGGNKYLVDSRKFSDLIQGKNVSQSAEFDVQTYEIFDLDRERTTGIYAHISLPVYYAPSVIKEVAQKLVTKLGRVKTGNGSPELLIEIDSVRRSDRANIDALFENLKKVNKVELLTYVVDTKSSAQDGASIALELKDLKLAGVALANFGSGTADIALLETLRPEYLILPSEFLEDGEKINESSLRAVAAISKALGIPAISPLNTGSRHAEMLTHLGVELTLKKFQSER